MVSFHVHCGICITKLSIVTGCREQIARCLFVKSSFHPLPLMGLGFCSFPAHESQQCLMSRLIELWGPFCTGPSERKLTIDHRE